MRSGLVIGKGEKMTEKAKGSNGNTDERLDKRLREINTRLGRDIKTQEAASRPKNDSYGNALKMPSEFMAAILVGAAIGYGLDWLLGTLPFAMIFFLFLGMIAGVMNMLRSAGEMSGSYELKANSEDQAKNE